MGMRVSHVSKIRCFSRNEKNFFPYKKKGAFFCIARPHFWGEECGSPSWLQSEPLQKIPQRSNGFLILGERIIRMKPVRFEPMNCKT
jgi:hypothetical protein